MAEPLHIREFGSLEHSLLGREAMHMTGLLVDKVPFLGEKIVVNDFFREADGHISLVLEPHEHGAIEIVRDDGEPLLIEYFTREAPRKPIAVLAEPVRSLLYTPIDFSSRYSVREEALILDRDGLQRFTSLGHPPK